MMPRPPVTKRKRDSNDESRDLWDPPSQEEEVPTIKRKKPLNLTPKGSSESRKVTDRLENWSQMDATPAESPTTDAPAPRKPKQKSKPAPSTAPGETPATPDPTSDNPFAVVKRRRGRDSDASMLTKGLVGFFTPDEVNMLENFKLEFCSTNSISGADFDMMVQHSDRDKVPFPHQDTIIKKQEFWRAVYATLPRRQSRSVYRFMRRHFNCSDQKPHHWTEEQDEELIGLHERYGPKWVLIARMIGRSDDDVIQRWKNKLEHRDTMKRGAWTEDEVWLLLNSLQTIWKKMRDAGQDVGEDIYCLEENIISWGHVSAMMGHTRSRQQCADRWRKTRRRMAQLRAGGRYDEVYNPANGRTSSMKLAMSPKPPKNVNLRVDRTYKSNQYVDESEDGGDEGEIGDDSMEVDTSSKHKTLPKEKSPVDQTSTMASTSKSKAPEPSQVAETPEPETNGHLSREATPETDGVEGPANKSDSDSDNDSSSDEDDNEVEAKQKTDAPKGPTNDDDSDNSSSSSYDEDDNETKQKDDGTVKPTAPSSNSEDESSDDDDDDGNKSVANETTDKSSDSESESDDETNPSETLSNPIETKTTPVANKTPTANLGKNNSQVESTPTPAQPQSQSRLQGMFGRFIKPIMKAASPPPLPRMATESTDDEESESSSDSSTDSDSDDDSGDDKKNAKAASQSPAATPKGYPAKRDIKKEKDNFFSDSEDN